ncbi:type II secretion system protein [Paraglaciecola aquimarina]|uniref:Type II secretion system protein n=1 Tax=Paraglaciecola aquimarina TaxID=1235557 RepID=A0ABU3SSX5_9ALTE|nr:type II secretion system protein [Paraglaciecola aquimarina]MDU0353117.1 type II secretion system protein [Paraglaciecola aquimarina]
MASKVGSKTNSGFTLVELITVIIVLGVVSVGISGFIRTGMDIYTDVNERDQVLSESRFVVERLNREVRQAIPNSARVKSNSINTIQCLEFVPALWASFYTSLSVYPDTTAQGTIVEFGDNLAGFQLSSTGTDYGFVYPVSPADIYDGDSAKRREVLSCTDTDDSNCATAGSVEHTASLTFADPFADKSPASRIYFARYAVSYCAHSSGNIVRHQTSIDEEQTVYSSGGVLMSTALKNNWNNTDDLPFRVSQPSLTRNGLVNLLLAFELNEEVVNYNVEVHIPNVP